MAIVLGVIIGAIIIIFGCEVTAETIGAFTDDDTNE